jgi:hypothetical protein
VLPVVAIYTGAVSGKFANMREFSIIRVYYDAFRLLLPLEIGKALTSTFAPFAPRPG